MTARTGRPDRSSANDIGEHARPSRNISVTRRQPPRRAPRLLLQPHPQRPLIAAPVIVDDPHRIAAGRARLPGIHFLTPSAYFVSTLPSTLATADAIAIAAAAFLMSCVATLYPSRCAARVRPAETLRDE